MLHPDYIVFVRWSDLYKFVNTYSPCKYSIPSFQLPMQASGPEVASWPTPSPVTVFLRNLRLLQLDQQPDWPGLSSRLFSPSQQLQRQRVKGVEWALYHLFALWDPEGAKQVGI